jgi:hypothetical protein
MVPAPATRTIRVLLLMENTEELIAVRSPLPGKICTAKWNYNCPWGSLGDLFKEPLWTPKSKDAQVPYIK